jgi:hypothetical protein
VLAWVFIQKERNSFAGPADVTRMNALPVKNPTPQAMIDDLIATFGTKTVIFAMIARLFKRTRPPDSTTFPGIADQPGVDQLTDHLRADIGLPPNEHNRIVIDPIIFGQPRM